MRSGTRLYFFCLIAFSFCVPFSAFADAIIDSDISEDTLWTKEKSPYLVQEGLMIDPNATLSIEPGVVVQFDSGGIDVLGRLLAKGSSAEPITFISVAGSEWYGLRFSNPETSSSLDHIAIRYARTGITDLYSKDLSISNARIEDGEYGIEAYGSHLSLNNFSAENMSSEALDISYGSDVTLKNIVLKNVGMSVQIYVDSKADISDLFIDGAQGEALAVYVGSSVHVASSTIKNVSQSYGAVEAFSDSSLDISGLMLEGVSGGEALSVFDHSQMVVRDSSVTNTNNYGAIAAFDSGSLTLKNVNVIGGSGDGLVLFGGGFLDMQDSVISGFTNGAGIADYGSDPDYNPVNSLSFAKNKITGNAVGVALYSDNSTYSISNNSIHDNATNGMESYRTAVADLRNNFWGDASGPYEDPDNLTGTGNGIVQAPGSIVIFSPWLSYWGTPPVSNVLFLPGIEGSRLYEGTGTNCGKPADEKLWEPLADGILKILRGAGDDKVKNLFLDATGESICSDIYTKVNDILDSVHGSNIYKSFIDDMRELKTDGVINDWKPVAYDWRLSLDDLLTKGIEIDRRIYYATTTATSTPYIEQTLRALAANSKTGKVTIIAHSNGGLVAKALLNQLGGETPKLVDKVIMVGAPQSGAPVAVGALLYGYDQGISKWGIPILHSAVARELAENSPMAYHLLPSQDYFDSVMDDPAHPVARFRGAAYTKEVSAYGPVIGNLTELDNFLRASSLNSTLVDYANSTHATLDYWTPPAGIEVSQIAGWGADTVAGIDFYTPQPINALTALNPMRMYRPIFTEDGDGTVTVPSALMMALNTNVKRYWVDLFAYNNETGTSRKHKDLFEIPPLGEFLKNIIKNSTSTLPAYISTTQPSPETESKKLTFFLHSPLTLQLTDSSGNITGLAEDGSMTQDIPDSTYGEFGEVKYITVPQGSSYQLTMHGQASGTFSLDIQESSGGVITASSTIANVPTTASTLASMSISNGIDTASALTVDENGDGKNMIVVTPKIGETVNYEPPAPVVISARSGGRNRALSIPATISTPAVVITQPADTSVVQVKNPSTSLNSAQDKSLGVKKVATSITPSKKVNIPQTASVYDASQQPILNKLGEMVYYSLHRLWTGLNRLFNLI